MPYQRRTKDRKAPRTAFKKGDPNNPKKKHPERSGRQKGVTNKFTRDIKEALLNAFGKVGGEDYLVAVAKADRKAFTSLIGRLLPTQLTGKDGAPLELLVTKAQGGLSNLSDKELEQLQTLLAKAGLKETST